MSCSVLCCASGADLRGIESHAANPSGRSRCWGSTLPVAGRSTHADPPVSGAAARLRARSHAPCARVPRRSPPCENRPHGPRGPSAVERVDVGARRPGRSRAGWTVVGAATAPRTQTQPRRLADVGRIGPTRCAPTRNYSTNRISAWRASRAPRAALPAPVPVSSEQTAGRRSRRRALPAFGASASDGRRRP